MALPGRWSFAAFSEISLRLPFRIRSCGTARCYPSNLQAPRTLFSLELIWGIYGIGKIIFPEGECLLHPGEVCCYLPGETHRLEVPESGFHYKWIAFEGPLILDFWRGFQIARTPHYAGPCPEELFEELIESIKKTDDESILNALSTGIRILTLSVLNKKPQKTAARRNYAVLAKALIDLEYSEFNLNINMIAESLSVHRVSLNRRFTARFGINISKYLMRKRMGVAMSLLLSTSHSVQEIALKSGFSDPGYFTRVFHGFTGMPPLEYRNLPEDESDRLLKSLCGGKY